MHASTLIRTESNRVAHPGSDAPEQPTTSQQNGLKAESRRSTGSEGAVSARKEEVEVEVDRILVSDPPIHPSPLHLPISLLTPPFIVAGEACAAAAGLGV